MTGPIVEDLAHRVELEALRLGHRAQLGGYALNRIRAEQRWQPELDALAVTLTTELMGRRGRPGIYEEQATTCAEVVRYASWWDHFKAVHQRRWWMRWRRWTVRHHWARETATVRLRVELAAHVVFPQAPDVAPVLGEPVVTISPGRSWIDVGRS